MRSALAILASVAAIGLGRPQTPVRDVPRLGTVGSATISGVVIADDDTHAALRRATVTLSRAGLEDMRTTLTDDQGRFRYAELPAGVYTLSARKAGYVTTNYGALQPGMPGTSISLIDGQRFPATPIPLPRGAVITGRLIDRDGQAMSDTVVLARSIVVVNGERRLRPDPAGGGGTNVHGEYRIYGLPPGQYLVCADGQYGPAERRTSAAELAWARQPGDQAPPPARLSSYASTCFPGTADPAGAATIVLRRGEERAGVDFTMQYVPVARVSGVVTAADGKPAAGVSVWRARSSDLLISSNSVVMRTGPDGAFSFANVPPGEFLLTARGAPSADVTALPNVRAGYTYTALTEWATADLAVSGGDINDVTLRLRPGMSVSGRVIFQGVSQAAPTDATRFSLVLLPATRAITIPGTPSASVRPDGTFQFEGVTPGRFQLARIGVPYGGWVVRSAMLGGQDLMDVPLDVRPGADVSDIVVTYVERLAGLAGTLVDAAGQATPQFYVFVFPVDRAGWTNGSRRVTSTRADVNGVYTIDGLPAGDYYVCALTELDRALQYESSYLEQLIPAALRITLHEGEILSQRLRVGG